MVILLVSTFLSQNHLLEHLQLPVLSLAKPCPLNINFNRSRSSTVDCTLCTSFYSWATWTSATSHSSRSCLRGISSYWYYFFFFHCLFETLSLLFEFLFSDVHFWIDLLYNLVPLPLLLFLCRLFSILRFHDWYFISNFCSSYFMVSLLRMDSLNEYSLYPL